MGRRSKEIDWEAVERDYRIGKLTVRQIADKYSVAVSSVSLKAKNGKWSRDLTEAVKIATKAALIENSKRRAEEIGTEIGTAIGTESEQGIKAAVSENVELILGHRVDISKLRGAVNMMLGELIEQTGQADTLNEIVDMLRAQGAEDSATAIRKLTSLSNRAMTAKTLMDTLHKVIDKEREAFGINDDSSGDKGNGIEDAIKRIDKAIANGDS